MGGFSIWHLLAFLVIVLVIFGTGKLTKIGPDLGNAIRGFKKALNSDEDATAPKPADGKEKLQADPPATPGTVHQEQHDSAESK